MLKPFNLLFALAFVLIGCTTAHADDHASKPADKIKVAILTGQNNHGWMLDTPVLHNILDDAMIFDTAILQTPDANDPDKAEKWAAFDPAFSDYDVVIINYNNKIKNGDMLPEKVRKNFEKYIAEGGKAYSFHAGNNAFQGWDAYEKMIGLLWRKNSYGKRIYFDDQGKKVVQEPGQGPGAGHGSKHPYVVDTQDQDHPIFKDLPKSWMHASDELYHGQRGPAKNMTILLTAYSDPKTRGTGVHEPICWTIPYGKGLVMTNVMGHWWKNQKDAPAVRCAGFQTLFTRSIEWLATGKVTLPKPDDFPTADKASMRELEPFKPLAYIYVKGLPGSDPLASCGCSTPADPSAIPLLEQYAHTYAKLPGEDRAQR